MSSFPALEEALQKYDGSPSRLAAAIGRTVVRQHVEHWLKVGRVPAEHCPAIERETGVRCEELCPGVAWDVLRMQAGRPDAANEACAAKAGA